MVVGRNSGESAVSGGVDGRLQPLERERLLTELHQRQVDAELHPTILPYSLTTCSKPPQNIR